MLTHSNSLKQGNSTHIQHRKGATSFVEEIFTWVERVPVHLLKRYLPGQDASSFVEDIYQGRKDASSFVVEILNKQGRKDASSFVVVILTWVEMMPVHMQWRLTWLYMMLSVHLQWGILIWVKMMPVHQQWRYLPGQKRCQFICQHIESKCWERNFEHKPVQPKI